MKRNEFIDNFNLATIPMMALMRLAPPDKIGWKPTEKSWTLGQLLHHCSGTPNIFNRIIDNSWPSLEELRKSMAASLTIQHKDGETAAKDFESNAAKIVERLKSLSDADFTGKQSANPIGLKGSLGRILQCGLDHQNTHKTELFMYLKLLGVPVNTGHLYMGKSI